MATLIDDVGSFPLPTSLDPRLFNRSYQLSRKAIVTGRNIHHDDSLWKNFGNIIIEAFRLKLNSGLDVVTYPQMYDGIKQVNDVIHTAMEKGTFIVDNEDAFLPEVELIRSEATRLSQELGYQIRLRVCLFGPMEQYLKEIGVTMYNEVLDGFAETIKRFAKNSILNTKSVRTDVISIDEPSFGLLDINAEKDKLVDTLEKAFDFEGAVRQIHLHSPSRLTDCLRVENIDVVSFEGAASSKNIEAVSKKMLDDADKQIRVGVSRTDIDSLLSELNDRGISKPQVEQIVEAEAVIKKRFAFAKEKFGDRLAFAGPDCGLGSWPSQDAACLLLKRTVSAIKSA